MSNFKYALTFVVAINWDGLPAQPGTLDSTFGTNGVVLTSIGGLTSDDAYSMAIQQDGKITVAGSSYSGFSVTQWALVRYSAGGGLDNTFGGSGIVTTFFDSTYSAARSVVIQTDGKIIAAGVSNPDSLCSAGTIARYNPNGSLDLNFGTNGKVIMDCLDMLDIASIALQADGRMVLVGTSTGVLGVVRLNQDGTPDNTFGTNGLVVQFSAGYGNACVIQPDGKIIAAGMGPNGFTITRLNTDGSIDNSFGTNGIASTTFGSVNAAYAVALQPDGKIVVAGSSGPASQHDFAVARFDSDGSLDNSFGTGGKVLTTIGGADDRARSAAVQPDGKILLAGWTHVSGLDYDFAVVRYNSDGTLDASFGMGGKTITSITNNIDRAYSVGLQPDGKVIAAGSAVTTGKPFALVRYISGLNLGVLNFSPATASMLVYPNPIPGKTTLEFTLLMEERITIDLADAPGRTLSTFMDSEHLPAGEHQLDITLPATLPSGPYLIVISSPSGRMSVQVFKK